MTIGLVLGSQPCEIPMTRVTCQSDSRPAVANSYICMRHVLVYALLMQPPCMRWQTNTRRAETATNFTALRVAASSLTHLGALKATSNILVPRPNTGGIPEGMFRRILGLLAPYHPRHSHALCPGHSSFLLRPLRRKGRLL